MKKLVLLIFFSLLLIPNISLAVNSEANVSAFINITNYNITSYPTTLIMATFETARLVSNSVFTVSSVSSSVLVATINNIITLSIGQGQIIDSDSNGYYDVNITLNSISNGLANITFYAASGAVPSEEAPPSGGGGGGAAPPMASEEQTIPQIVKEKPETIKISEKMAEDLPIYEVELLAKETVSDVKMVIQKTEKPMGVLLPVEKEAGSTYHYASIYISKKNIVQESKIRFKVEKSWISKNNINKDAVFLSRLVEKDWEILKTRKINEDRKYVYFESDSAGFSVFAISGLKKGIKIEFEVFPELIKVSSKFMEKSERNITIKNTGQTRLSFSLFKTRQISEFISINETEFYLRPGEEKNITLSFSASQLGVQTGKIVIDSDYESKEIKVILEVESESLLFELNMDVPAEYTQVAPGKNITMFITVKNFKREKIKGMEAEYIFKDMNNNILFSEKEKMDIDTQESFSRKVPTSPEWKFGDYILVVQMKYQGTLALSSKLITLMEKTEVEEMIRIRNYMIVSLLMLGIIIVIIMQVSHRIKLKEISKMGEKDIRKLKGQMKYRKRKDIEENRKIIEDKLKLLEDAYKRGYITEKSFREGKKKLERIIDKK